MTLTSKERNFLRKLAHNLEPIVRIGKNDLDENVYESISQAISTHELIKVKVLNNSSLEITRDLVENIADKTKTYAIGTIGNNIILFKPRYVNNKAGKITEQFNDFRGRS